MAANSPITDRALQIVGNAGNINRKYSTCAVARFPEVVVHRYRQKTNTLHVLSRDCVPEPELQASETRLWAWQSQAGV